MPRYIDADLFSRCMEHEAFEKDSDDQMWNSGYWIRYRMFERVLKATPTANVVERKKVKWIDDKGLYRCSACNHLWSELWWTSVVPANKMYETMRFCPNCGAEMRKETEDG